MTNCTKILNQVEAVRHYLHLQIGKPIKPELASAPEIALDQLKAMLSAAPRTEPCGGMENCVDLSEANQMNPRSSTNASMDATTCAVCGGEFTSKRTIIDGRTMHPSCAIMSFGSHTHDDMARAVNLIWELRTALQKIAAKNSNEIATKALHDLFPDDRERDQHFIGVYAASIEPQVSVAHGNEPEHAPHGEANPCGGWPSEDEIAEAIYRSRFGMPFASWQEMPNSQGKLDAYREARAVLSALPRLQWPSEEVDRIARILDPIAFIKVKAAEAGRGDTSTVRYQNRCRDARKLAGEVLAALPRPQGHQHPDKQIATPCATDAADQSRTREKSVLIGGWLEKQADADGQIKVDGVRYDGVREGVNLAFDWFADSAAQGWREISSAPKDGRWLIGLCHDRETVIRVSWGVDREGMDRWCGTTKSYGDGMFCAFVECGDSPARESVDHSLTQEKSS